MAYRARHSVSPAFLRPPYFAQPMDRSKVYLTREQSRRVDQLAIEAGMTGISLMDMAAKRCVRLLNEGEAIRSVNVFCGTGNNGGDGFVIARRLALLGVAVKIFVCGDQEQITGDALTNFKIAKSLDLLIVPIEESWSDSDMANRFSKLDGEPVDWIVDCLLGTGASGDPRPPMNRVISGMNSLDVKRFAVDIPSGLDCETGQPGDPTIKADLTCTFVAMKTGFEAEAAKPYLGKVRIGSIGVSDEIVEQVLAKS